MDGIETRLAENSVTYEAPVEESVEEKVAGEGEAESKESKGDTEDVKESKESKA
jgi:hypothetical protein